MALDGLVQERSAVDLFGHLKPDEHPTPRARSI